MVNRHWLWTGLVAFSFQIAQAQTPTGDQFNAATQEDCFRKVEQALYAAQIGAQATEAKETLNCQADGTTYHACEQKALQAQSDTIRLARQEEIDGNARCKLAQKGGVPASPSPSTSAPGTNSSPVNPAPKTWTDGDGNTQPISNRDIIIDPKSHKRFAFPHTTQDFVNGVDCTLKPNTVQVEVQQSATGVRSDQALAKCADKSGRITKTIRGLLIN
jgi:hypothetical protein